jgi:hypothetical protein
VSNGVSGIDVIPSPNIQLGPLWFNSVATVVSFLFGSVVFLFGASVEWPKVGSSLLVGGVSSAAGELSLGVSVDVELLVEGVLPRFLFDLIEVFCAKAPSAKISPMIRVERRIFILNSFIRVES